MSIIATFRSANWETCDMHRIMVSDLLTLVSKEF
jgi:hypothetical protein